MGASPFFVCGVTKLNVGERQIESLIRPLVEGMGCDLWGCEFHSSGRHGTLRVYIDREGGVTLDDCVLLSGQISALLDVEDPIQLPYALEVSSPGIDRPLLSPEHYRSCAGSRVKLRLVSAGKRRSVTGALVGLNEDGTVRIATEGEVLDFPLADIVAARVVPEWN